MTIRLMILAALGVANFAPKAALRVAPVVTAEPHPACGPTLRPTLQEYSVDAGESILEFSIPFAFSRVKGRFTDAKGTILYDSVSPSRSSITVVIDAKSLASGSQLRDNHLRSPDFFDVEKYPTIEFRSTRLSDAGGRWIVEGDLTIHGVTKRIAIPFRFLHPATRDPVSHWMMLNVVGEVRLARADFGIFGGSAFNSWFNKARAATMGDSVDIDLEMEAYRADAASQQSVTIDTLVARIRSDGVKSQISRLEEIQRLRPQELGRYLTGYDFVVRALLAGCRVHDAVMLSSALTRFFPDSHRARLIHGFALAISGDKAGAAAEYAEAKRLFRPPQLDPSQKVALIDDTWWYLNQLARTALEWGYSAEVIPLARTIAEMYSQSASTHPRESARARATYGQALAAAGDSANAAAAFAQALEIDPGETSALEWRRRLGAGSS